MYTGSDNEVAANPTNQHMSVSVEKINYGDDKGKFRVHYSSSRSEVYDDMTAALRAMSSLGAPRAVTIGKSISFYVIDKTRRVRTPEGAKRYGLPIGSPITAEAQARAKLGRGKPANSGLKSRMDAAKGGGGTTKGRLSPDTKKRINALMNDPERRKARAAQVRSARGRRGGSGGPAARQLDATNAKLDEMYEWRRKVKAKMESTNSPATKKAAETELKRINAQIEAFLSGRSD